MIKAYSYIRFSSTRQINGDSLRRQTELSERYAETHGLKLDDTLNLRDLGLSAFDRSNVERGALGAFLTAVKRGEIAPGSYLLVESLDRLSRDQLLGALTVFLDIIRSGIVIVTLTDNMVYEQNAMGENFSSLLISITIMARAHDESATKSKRLRAAWLNKIQNAGDKKLTARCPAWMRLSADGKRFELIPERVEIVKEIIRLSQSGLGQWVIAKRFNARNEPNWSGKEFGWNVSYVCKILNNPALYGEFQPRMSVDGKLQPHGDPISDYFPAVMSRDEFVMLQAARKSRVFAKARKGTNVPNLFSGLLKCGYCGASMNLIGSSFKTAIDSHGNKTRQANGKVLMCERGRRGLNCYAPRWDYQDFEKSFLTFCTGLDLSKLLSDASAAQQTTKQALEEALIAVDAKLADSGSRVQNLVSSIESGSAPQAILRRMETLEAEIHALHDQRESLHAQINTHVRQEKDNAAEMKSLQSIFQQLKVQQGDDLFKLRAALADRIRRFVKDVRVYPAGSIATQEDIDSLKAALATAMFPEEKIDAWVKHIRTGPERSGKTGRYAYNENIDRQFIIRTRHGGIRYVQPDFNNPAKLKVLSWMHQSLKPTESVREVHS